MAVYTGKVIPYGSGASWFIRVTVTNTPATTASTVTVSYVIEVVFSHSIYDSSNSGSWNIGGHTGSANNFSYSSSSGRAFTIGSGSFAATVSYTKQNTFSVVASVTGLASGGTGPSSVNTTYTLPKRLPSAPSRPATPTVTGVDQAEATVNMTLPANNGATITHTRYRLYTAATGGSLVSSYESASAATSYRFTGLSASTTYYAEVAAKNSVGWSAASTRKAFTTPAATKPDAPARPTTGTITDTTAAIYWTAPDANGATITGYQLQVAESSAFAAPVVDLSLSAHSRNVSGLRSGTTYYARVRANSNLGPSSWSPVLTFTTTGVASTFYLGVGGAAKPLAVYLGVSGAAKPCEVYLGVGGVAKRVV